MIRVGQKFHQERIRRGLSIDDVAKGTKIRPSFISAIEKGEYHKIPSPSYAKGFVRNYAEFLGLPSREMLALFRREVDVEKSYGVLPETYTKREDLRLKKSKIQVTMIAVIGIVVLLGAFLLYQYRSAFFSPALTIETPKETTIASSQVIVSGTADSSATVTVNNTPVALDAEGKFRKTVTVFPGKQTILIKATNRLGKETVVEKEIEVRE